MNGRQPPPRILKSGKILLRNILFLARFAVSPQVCLEIQTTVDIPAVFDFLIAGQPARTCKTVWRDNTQIGIMFIQRE